ncbi:DUF2780 domain-containing protein [Candidatus Sororendozoicomonas aggregata]|uniref:DUF2780 domain-containing protein n=1 Tax=Candidatus Sororendozoicomonas aggregata TaxID=3073239 RepID=UPI002ED43C49
MLSVFPGCSKIPYFSQTQPQTIIDKSSLPLTLTNSLGITYGQAVGGAGVLLNVAANMLSSTDYTKVIAAIPNANSLLSAVPALGKKSTSTSGLSNAYSYLTEQFQRLGLSNSMINEMDSVLIEYLRDVSSTEVSQLFQLALRSTIAHSTGSLMSTVSLLP